MNILRPLMCGIGHAQKEEARQAAAAACAAAQAAAQAHVQGQDPDPANPDPAAEELGDLAGAAAGAADPVIASCEQAPDAEPATAPAPETDAHAGDAGLGSAASAGQADPAADTATSEPAASAAAPAPAPPLEADVHGECGAPLQVRELALRHLWRHCLLGR